MNETTETVKEWARGLFNTSPAHELAEGTLSTGYKPLAAELASLEKKGARVIAIDGYHGTQWNLMMSGISGELDKLGISHEWSDISDSLLPQSRLTEITEPFLGGDDPIFGRVWPLGVEPFFNAAGIADVRRNLLLHKGSDSETLHLVCGTGASLVGCQDVCWYSDVSKQNQQLFCREGIITNWTTPEKLPFASWYKRSYFVEWPAQNKLKQALLPVIDRFIDFNNPEEPVSLSGDDFRNTLGELSRTPFRPRPWFAPGPWGGQFMKGHMGLDADEPNFAWSFELIAPENGVLVSSGDWMLEFSFDYLLYHDNIAVMGAETARRFGTEWPVRFDYLDTIEGGNLSVQVHPSNEYIRSEFGETFTQDETYYISKAEPGALVYLGLKEDADPLEFRKKLELSAETGEEVDIDRFVNSLPAKDHDLFYIPNGTIHCSGAGNLVLEISATPYIYTFKLYDYLRRDLNGNLRPINLERGFDNLKTDRTTGWVNENLVARPRILSESAGCTEWVLMDVPYMFYVINRIDFDDACEFRADGLAYMVNLVEGDKVDVISDNGRVTPLAYLESMVIPASAGRVQFVNKGKKPCKMVKVYVRPGHEQ